MEPTTQSTGGGMFGGSQQGDDTTLTTEETTQATGMFGGSQQGDDSAVTTDTNLSDSLPVVSDETVIETQDIASQIPAPTFMRSFEDQVPENQLSITEVVAQTTPVEEVVAQTTPVEEVVAQTTPVEEVVAQTPTPLTFLTANQEEQKIQAAEIPSNGSKAKGIETLKQAPEFKGIDIDAIIAHTDPTATGAAIANTNTSTQIPSVNNFKKMAAIGGGVFALLGVGVWVLSSMYSAGISTDTLQADVQQTQENLVDTETDVTPQEDDVETGSDQPTSDDNTNSATDSVTEVSTTTQPSFGASDSTPDLIEQVGEPSNALVDTVGHITALEEKIAIVQNVVDDATQANEQDAIKYGTFAITKYKEIVEKLKNGGYESNKDVTDLVAKIDQFYNKAIDIMNNN